MKITEKNVNPKFETTESNLKKFDLTVTLSNQLVDSIVEMDAMPQKIYLYAIGHLDPKNPPFNRIRQKSPILYRWVMNAVRYEGYRW
ncbi:hypothetical protein [Enterococcus faecium]|uniref:hypothetical protein n=1 Tax=Enterococcus faecium TaxID=1352 RepID=UPI00215C011A|nr:hypothetical protein [Enterococcus faecium]